MATFDIPDWMIPIFKMIALGIGIIFVVYVSAFSAGIAFHAGTQQQTQETVQTVVATPTPTPAPSQVSQFPFWTGPQEIQSMTTGSGPQINTYTPGGYYYVPWQAYSALEPGDWVSFHVVSESSPWQTTMFNADQVVLTGYNYPVKDGRYQKVYPGTVTIRR
jgi:hypothetical protein